MKKSLILNSFLMFLACNIWAQNIVETGIEVLKSNNFDMLKGKRVGLITNPTGVDNMLKSTIDILNEAANVDLVALFGPEHGVRGEFAAGEKVSSYTDEATGLIVYSLYGKTRKPTNNMLEGIDVLVYDIQDIGCRAYTYISTMGYAMEAAAENNIEFLVLDRPNPLGGIRIEGNILDERFKSFIGRYQIPYIYGLTCGELATLLNNEGYLDKKLKCDLEVVKMKNWQRSMTYDQTGLHWVPTSTHIPDWETTAFCAATGIAGELGSIFNNGVGYTMPFQLFGVKNIDLEAFTSELELMNIDGVIFRPITYKPYYGGFANQILNGVQIYFTNLSVVNIVALQYQLIEALAKSHENYVDWNKAPANQLRMFDYANGSDKIRKYLMKSDFGGLFNFLESGKAEFQELAGRYYFY